MRHTICAVSVRKATAPASCACRVGHAATARALVALGGTSLCSASRLARARGAAVALTTVAVAAQQDLVAAARAQKQANWTVHAYPRQTEVLDGRVPARHTAMAPPSSARCRVRRGRQASRPERPLPCPPSSASGTVVSRAVAAAQAGSAPAAPTAVRAPKLPSTPHHGLPRAAPRLPGRPAGRPGKRTTINRTRCSCQRRRKP